MQWREEDVRWAFRLFVRLLATGAVGPEERDLLYAFQRSEVREILERVVEPEAGVKIFSVGESIYLTPGVDNPYFGYTHEELRERMNLQNNTELYLAFFAMLCLLAAFYNSDDAAGVTRQFVTVEELEGMITEHLATVAAMDAEAAEALEVETRLNWRRMAEAWQDLPRFDEKVKALRMARNNRISFLLRVMAFLEREGLVEVLDEREIRLLPKAEHLVEKYYFNAQRKDLLLGLLAEGLDKSASRGASGKEGEHAAALSHARGERLV